MFWVFFPIYIFRVWTHHVFYVNSWWRAQNPKYNIEIKTQSIYLFYFVKPRYLKILLTDYLILKMLTNQKKGLNMRIQISLIYFMIISNEGFMRLHAYTTRTFFPFSGAYLILLSSRNWTWRPSRGSPY